jgi:DNA-binding MarR family transcriptional regulator
MNVATAVQHMTKMYLDRLVGSFSKDVRKFDEEDSRKFIEKNIKEIKAPTFIAKKLNFDSYPYATRLHLNHLLVFLLLQRQHTVAEAGLYDRYAKHIKEQIKRYKNKDILLAVDSTAFDILSTVYNVAYANNDLSADEEHVIEELKAKVNITDVEAFALLATMRPIDKDLAITPTQFDAALKELQNMGLVYFLNKDVDERQFVIPTEVAAQLAKHLRYPMDIKSFHLLFDDCSKPTLVKLASYAKIKSNNTKEALIQQLYDQGRSAQELLNQLSRDELDGLARGVDGMHTSGSKEEIAKRLLDYFFILDTMPLAGGKKTAPTDDQLWEYFDLMGRREYALLRQMNIIKKDLEIEHLFEQLTRYAFNKLGNLKLVSFRGSNNPDGGAIGEDGSVLLWDNKSQELAYTLSLSHHKQFLQYVIQANRNISSFLIVTGSVEDAEAVEMGCIKLSGEARVNIGVVSAVTFKSFFDMYAKTSNGKPLNLQVFNHTGVITSQVLERRYKTFK